MAFPSSPANGQIYKGYIYNSTTGSWRGQNAETISTAGLGSSLAATSSTADANLISVNGIVRNNWTSHAPSVGYYEILSMRDGDSLYGWQMAFTLGGSGAYIRRYDNGVWRVEGASDANGWSSLWQPTVRASYSLAAPQTPTNVQTIIQANTRLEDTHSAVTTGTSWKFTAPIPGVYMFDFGFSAGVGSNADNYVLYALWKNNAQWQNLLMKTKDAAGTIQLGQEAGGAATIRLIAGDYIDLRWNCANTTSIGNISTGLINITKIGA